MQHATLNLSRWLISAAFCLAVPWPLYAVKGDTQRAAEEQSAEVGSRPARIRKPSAEQLAVGREAQSANVQVEWHPRLGTPQLIRGAGLQRRRSYSGGKGLVAKGAATPEQNAVAVVDNLARFYGVRDAQQEFTARGPEQNSLGFSHVRLGQVHQGLRVFGAELSVHFDQSGQAYQVNGQYVSELQVEVVPKLAAAAAVSIAQQRLASMGLPEGTLTEGPTLVIFARDTEPQLAYELRLAYENPGNTPGRWRYWIDAAQGQVLLAYNDVEHIAPPTANGTAAVITGNILSGEGGQSVSLSGWRENTGYYYLYSPNRSWKVSNVAAGGYPDYSTYAYRSSSAWGTSDRVEMSLARNFDTTQRYFREVHGRNSFDNAGGYAQANAHEGTGYVNAYWDGTDFHFGDGNGIAANSLAVLDICAHEYTHAVTTHTAGLIYWGESGALNESFSDIFGTCVEFYAQADGRGSYPNRVAGAADWLIGEDCWLSSVALRDLRNPRNVATVGASGVQPSLYLGTYWYSGSSDNGGVHRNSGVQNFVFYLLSEGGSGNNDGFTYTVTGIGLGNAQKVAHRALTVYCTPNTDYQGARAAWISAALDLNPLWSNAVNAAWSAAGVRTPLQIPMGDALNAPGLSWTTGGNANWSPEDTVTHDGAAAAWNGAIRDSQEAWLETTVTGPGTLSYWWKVSSEANYDFLRVSVDGSEAGKISGETGWEQRSLEIPIGAHSIRWRYTKDASDIAGADRAWVDQVNFITTTPTAAIYGDWRSAVRKPDGTLARPFPTVTQGVTAVTSSGTVKVRAGSYAYPARLLNKPMRLESYDGRVLISATGSSGSTTVPTPIGQLSSPVRQPDGSMSFHFASVPGVQYQVLTSTDLVNWQIWKNFTAEEETAELVALNAASEPMRFFKVVMP